MDIIMLSYMYKTVAYIYYNNRNMRYYVKCYKCKFLFCSVILYSILNVMRSASQNNTTIELESIC